MLIKVSHPQHPLSRQTATGGSNTHKIIEQQRLTIIVGITFGDLRLLNDTILGVVGIKESQFTFS